MSGNNPENKNQGIPRCISLLAFATMKDMSDPFTPDYRIGDAERQQAMDDLGTHWAAGRLDYEDYEKRLDHVTQAQTRSDISYIFDDLPACASRNQYGALEKTYTESEIMQVRAEGRRTRAGIMAITTVLAFGFGVSLNAPVLLVIVPIVFALLYLMKVGPDSWYVPSRAKLERERMRNNRLEMAERTREIESRNALQQAEMKALRKQRTQELTNTALELTNDTIRRLRNRNK